MHPQIRYQVFVSSTYEDLREERQQATQAILETGGFSSGMELFPASDDTQWELIKQVITEADYYVVIVGGMYGTIGPNRNSFTEMEYDFALECQVPVLGFVKSEINELPSKFVESDRERREQLDAFRAKVMSRTCRKFRDPLELGMAVMQSLMHESRVRPRIGWIRGDQARSDEDRQREIKLQDALDSTKDEVRKLERKIRDRAILVDEIPREQLSQGTDQYYFTVIFRDENKQVVTEKVPMSWDEIFEAIGPTMYGYIIRKGGTPRYEEPYLFQKNIEQFVRTKIVYRAQGRKIEIQASQIDTCVFQLKELGYIQFSEKNNDEGSVFRGITLTEYGEHCLSLLKTQKR